jgi:hypothetical protein
MVFPVVEGAASVPMGGDTIALAGAGRQLPCVGLYARQQAQQFGQ